MDTTYPKHALITGATSGIGYELAKIFAKNNYNLILVARNAENLQQTAAELTQAVPGIHAHTLVIDLFEEGAAQQIYNATTEMGIRVDVLVNNAGQGEWGKFTNTDLERELDIIRLNIIAPMTLTKLYLKDMVAHNSGKILQQASSVSKAPSPYLSVYAATKAFLLSLTEALITEVADTGVTLTALQPGATDTDFFHKAKAENSVTYKEATFYTPEEVAQAGYDGLMKGEATVVPGFINKTQGAINSIIPDSVVAANMERQMEPSNQEEGKTSAKHKASLRERESINAASGATHGDYVKNL